MRLATILIALTLPVSAFSAEVYRSVDAQGHVQYSDTPTPGAELISVSARNGNEVTTPSKPASKSDADEQIAKDQAQQAVQKDVSTVRADQCKKATDQYQQYLQSRRIYKTLPNGDREYMTDADADALRLSARQTMETACAPATS
jgi:hypothetical protein